MSKGFALNGTHCSTYGIIMKSKKRQILPATTDTYIQIPGRHGSYLFHGELTDGVDDLECGLIQNTLENLRIKSHEIAAWLYTTDRVILTYDDEPDKFYMAKQEGAIDPEQIATMETFTVRLRYEPTAYGAEVIKTFASDTVTVTNPGTFETLPIFNATFTATATEWKVTLGTKYVRVVHAFAIGDTLEVNCATGAVLINGLRALDKLDWQNSEFFVLPPGENILTILPVGVCAATITFNPRWL